jgi:hypothetical protein
MEEWRPTHSLMYEVSNLGRVRSYATKGSKYGSRMPIPHILRAGPDSFGYPIVVLEHRQSYRVHSLVTEAFIGPRPAGLEVMHADDMPANTCVDNLSYGTRAQNQLDCSKRGRRPSKLTASNIKVIRQLFGCMSQRAIAKQFGVGEALISAIKVGRAWTYVT